MAIYNIRNGGLSLKKTIELAKQTPEADTINLVGIKSVDNFVLDSIRGLTINGNGASIDATGKQSAILVIDSSYVNLSGFDIYKSKGNGLDIRTSHHVVGSEIHSHHNGNRGGYAYLSNYININHSEFNNNSQGGLSFHLSANIGNGATTYQNWIQNNSFHDNWSYTTEGQGWLIDENHPWRAKHIALGYEEFKGKTIVSGNISYHNLGPGGQVYHSDNVVVTDNVLVYNNLGTHRNNDSELRVNFSNNTKVIDNIMISDGNDKDDFIFSSINNDNISFKGNHGLIEDSNFHGMNWVSSTRVDLGVNFLSDHSLDNYDYHGVETNILDW